MNRNIRSASLCFFDWVFVTLFAVLCGLLWHRFFTFLRKLWITETVNVDLQYVELLDNAHAQSVRNMSEIIFRKTGFVVQKCYLYTKNILLSSLLDTFFPEVLKTDPHFGIVSKFRTMDFLMVLRGIEVNSST